MTDPISISSKFNSSARSTATQQPEKTNRVFSRGHTEDSTAAKQTSDKNGATFSRKTSAEEKDGNRLTQRLFNGLGRNARVLLPTRVFNHLSRNAAQAHPQQAYQQAYLPAGLPIRNQAPQFPAHLMNPTPFAAFVPPYRGNEFALGNLPPAYSPRLTPAPMALQEPLPAYPGMPLGEPVLMPDDIVVTRF